MTRDLEPYLQVADEDYRFARELIEANHWHRRGAAFFLQQAVEKYLKALIQERGERPGFIHDLVSLLMELPELLPDMEELIPTLEAMTTFAVDLRYHLEIPDEEQLHVALEAASTIRTAVLRRLAPQAD